MKRSLFPPNQNYFSHVTKIRLFRHEVSVFYLKILSKYFAEAPGSDNFFVTFRSIKVITKLPNSEQSYKGKVKTHNYINRQNQSTTGKL